MWLPEKCACHLHNLIENVIKIIEIITVDIIMPLSGNDSYV